jgi:hypothetical protein
MIKHLHLSKYTAELQSLLREQTRIGLIIYLIKFSSIKQHAFNVPNYFICSQDLTFLIIVFILTLW